VRAYFDGESTRYLEQRYQRPGCDQLSYASRRRLALEMLDPAPGRILDIGSGPGVLTASLLERGTRLCEVDISLEMLRESRRLLARDGHAGRATFVEGRLPQLPFPDGSFDTVTCIGVLAYLDHPPDGMREIRRVLRPGGAAIVQVSNSRCVTARLHSALRRIYHHVRAGLGGPSVPHLDIPMAAFRYRQLERDLCSAGLRPEAWAFYDFRPPLLEWLAPRLALAVTRRLQVLERARATRGFSEGAVVKTRAS
jgi:SAM-dependent methyltransferase